MIRIKNNSAEVILKITSKIKQLQDVNGIVQDKLLRAIASTAAGLIRYRVHILGENSNGQQIGTYSAGYLKYRQKKYNRTSDPKVILSATRQMENDLGLSVSEPIRTQRGYAVGFKNPFNADKAQWLQEGRSAHTVSAHSRVVNGKSVKVNNYPVKAWKGFGQVYKLTADERQKLLSAAKEFISTSL